MLKFYYQLTAISALWFQFMWKISVKFSFGIENCGISIIRIPKHEGAAVKTFLEFSSIFPHFTRLFRLFSSSESRRELKTIRLWIEMVEIMGEYYRKITNGAMHKEICNLFSTAKIFINPFRYLEEFVIK